MLQVLPYMQDLDIDDLILKQQPLLMEYVLTTSLCPYILLSEIDLDLDLLRFVHENCNRIDQ